MIGPIINGCALAIGGAIGATCGRWLPARVKDTLALILGVITISLGAPLVGKAAYMHIVVIAMLLGVFVGELFRFEFNLERLVRKIMQWSKKHDKNADDAFIVQYIMLITLFCFGSTGIFGAFSEGMTGKPDILLIKSALDFFVSMVFAATLGIRVSLIAVPQFIILSALYFSAQFLMPLVSPAMLGDFYACGGVIFLATGLRMCGIKMFPVINMLPAFPFVLPLSWLWTVYFV